ncbi:lipase lipl-1-like [Penaeus indicus]|uniref:lipase lipl-1-like n=1 Tax=Penaeus indicus TaxID=29960 RepID=UPI00300D7799
MKTTTTAWVVILGIAGVMCAPPASVVNEVKARLQAKYRSGDFSRSDHWGVNMTTPELIEAFGYPVETHHLTTEDGYILEMHRIPHGISGPSESRPVAFLEHCLLCSSADYIMNVPEKALENHLLTHAIKDTSNTSFSTSKNYPFILTGAEAVYYAGWSMGTTVFWAMMSEKPEYNQKVKAMAAMAPVAFMDHAEGPIMSLAPYSDDIDFIATLLGVGEFLPSSELLDHFVETFCDVEAATAEVCYNFLFLLAGPDPDEIPKDFLPIILAHTPAGASVHTVNHYAQLVMSGVFSKYDYGLIGNLNHYGQNTPPLFNLSKVTAPVGLFWGATDWLADPTDVARLAEGLPNLALNHKVDKEEFNHLDFGWGIHADELVYRHILDFFANY